MPLVTGDMMMVPAGRRLNVVFRADASREIGTGHLMRCLSLAREFELAGHSVAFTTRNNDGVGQAILDDAGFGYQLLPAGNGFTEPDWCAHANWLGVGWSEDAEQMVALLADADVDVLVVDSYALDWRWESVIAGTVGIMVVVDDLADRAHECMVLIDQNLHGGMGERYEGLVPRQSICLLGPEFALLRPEFGHAHERAHVRVYLGRILVLAGGVDTFDTTNLWLDSIEHAGLSTLRVDVVVGAGYQAAGELAERVGSWSDARLHVQTHEVARLMSAADLCLGAVGSSTWERASVGLPAIAIALADNQMSIGQAAGQAGILRYLGRFDQTDVQELSSELRRIATDVHSLTSMSANALALVDGRGALRVREAIEAASEVQG